MEFFISIVFLILKWKIYVLSETMSDKIFRSYWNKQLCEHVFFVFHILLLKNWILDF